QPPALEDQVDCRVTVVDGPPFEGAARGAAEAVRVDVGGEPSAQGDAGNLPALQITLLVVVDGAERSELQAPHEQRARLTTAGEVRAPSPEHAEPPRQRRRVPKEAVGVDSDTD